MAGERVSYLEASLENSSEEILDQEQGERRLKPPFRIAGSGVWSAGMFVGYIAASGALTREAVERGVFEDVDSRKAMIIFGATFATNLLTLAWNTRQSIKMVNHEKLEAGQNFFVTSAIHGIRKVIPDWRRFRDETLIAGVLTPTVVKDGALAIGSFSYEHALVAAISTNVVGTVLNTVQAAGSEGIMRRVGKVKQMQIEDSNK